MNISDNLSVRIYGESNVGLQMLKRHFNQLKDNFNQHSIPLIKWSMDTSAADRCNVFVCLKKHNLTLDILFEFLNVLWVSRWNISHHSASAAGEPSKLEVVARSGDSVPKIPENVSDLRYVPCGSFLLAVILWFSIDESVSGMDAHALVKNLLINFGFRLDNDGKYDGDVCIIGCRHVEITLSRDLYNEVRDHWSVFLKCVPHVSEFGVQLHLLEPSGAQPKVVLFNNPSTTEVEMNEPEETDSPTARCRLFENIGDFESSSSSCCSGSPDAIGQVPTEHVTFDSEISFDLNPIANHRAASGDNDDGDEDLDQHSCAMDLNNDDQLVD